ncbi:MAG: hypothetical protein HOW73_11970 [Polyangiaceae bacterium]|nr:hypothetical protein [Polyangiaceae bacterium]
MGESRAYVYEPGERAAGVYVVVPGLHFLGPDDPRLDRFCRILAASGFAVVAPFVRAFSGMVLDRTLFDDANAALFLGRIVADEHGAGPPAVFSISFGSLLALHLAASNDPPAAVLVFGGYADFLPTVRFAVTGRADHEGARHQLARDPLNSPVVFLNVVDHLEMRGDRAMLARAWLSMVHRTWGKMELKAPGARDPHANAIAAALPSELRVPFLRGCCLDEGALDWLEDGLARAARSLSFLDPSAHVKNARCPVVLVHGKDDDVIPYFESVKLSRALPKEQLRNLHLTGLYGHTGASSPTLRALATETTTLIRMLADLAAAPRINPRARFG